MNSIQRNISYIGVSVFYLVLLVATIFTLMIHLQFKGDISFGLHPVSAFVSFFSHMTFLKFLIISIYGFFVLGSVHYLYTLNQLYTYFKEIKTCKKTKEDIELLAKNKGVKVPQIAILVPARNEGFVIENTVRRLEKMDYPKGSYSIFIIVDERELDDKVERFTKDVFYEATKDYAEKYGPHFAQCIEVPKWYSGVFGSMEKTYERSTKGRALNYVLQVLHTHPEYDNIDLIGVLDADGRLDTDVLKEVAYKRIMFGSQILQGPVFQVSNFSQITTVGVMAGLELAIHHMTQLPARLLKNKVQFLAGTNYFIEKALLVSVGGWNQYTMVEDAELALRVYIQTRIKATWLSCPEIEQSPENFKIYKKQRERWVRGHLELISDILASNLDFRDKLNFIGKICISQFRFLIDFGLPIIAWTLTIEGYMRFQSTSLLVLSIFLFIISIFIWDLYGFMYRRLLNYINPEMKTKQKVMTSSLLFISVPMIMVVQAVPRFLALVNFTFYRRKIEWYKTERTKELVTE